MNAHDAIFALGALFAFGGGGLALVLTQSLLYDAVRIRRPDIWEAMGRPSMVTDATSWDAHRRSSEAAWHVTRLIFKGAEALGDPVIARRVWQARVAFLYCIAILAMAVVFIAEPSLLK